MPKACSRNSHKYILDLIIVHSHIIPVDAQVVVEGVSGQRVSLCRLTLDHSLRFLSTATQVSDFSKADDASVLTYLAHEFSEFMEFNYDSSTLIYTA